jgi:dihydrofolate synthase/folylpolyglutamate synthase
MTYSSAVEYLYGLQRHGIKLGLDTMETLLERLGHPHRRWRALHVGGTNGKGSTAAMAASVLQCAGLRVGLYTSPHLVDFRERIRINGGLISEDRVAGLTERVREASAGLEPTFFETTTALAFLHFAEAEIGMAVVEVGLGGRFDATNVLVPEACAITTIGLDHQEYLGPTEEKIAFEKAGIIKSGRPVVLGRMSPSARAVIAQVAEARSAPVRELGRDFAVEGAETDRFDYRSAGHGLRDLRCGLAGRHQVDNAACALALLEAAGGEVWARAEPAVREGLRHVQWDGRLEIIEQHPTVLLDGAHNPSGAEALAAYLREFRRGRPDGRVFLVVAMMRDKDHAGFMAPFEPLVAEVFVTQAALARSASASELQRVFVGWRQPVHAVPVPADALAEAKRRARPEDLVCVTGSLMLVGEIKAAVRGCGLSPLRG